MRDGLLRRQAFAPEAQDIRLCAGATVSELLIADQAARTPGTLLAVMLMPLPELQTSRPKSALTSATLLPTACA